MKRRRFLKLTATGVIVSGTYGYFYVRNNNEKYEKLASETWQHKHLRDHQFKSHTQLMKELIRYGTLAANSHNTQAWKFKMTTNGINIMPDYTRRCPAVDPDDHHLFASLGCATENIVISAAKFGFKSHVIFNQTDDVVNLEFEPTIATESDLYLAIPNRQCTRSVYDGRSIPINDFALLQDVAKKYNVSVQAFSDLSKLESILEYVIKGNTHQMNDASFVKELKHWIRFNKSAAIMHGDGLSAASTGSPGVPSWLGNLLFNLVFKVDSENDKYRKQIKSSSAVMAFVSATDDKQGWINVGRSYQRTALQATALGIKHAFINQAIEVPEVRSEFAKFLNIGAKRPNLLIRLGYAHDMPKSLRRPLTQVIIG